MIKPFVLSHSFCLLPCYTSYFLDPPPHLPTLPFLFNSISTSSSLLSFPSLLLPSALICFHSPFSVSLSPYPSRQGKCQGEATKRRDHSQGAVRKCNPLHLTTLHRGQLLWDRAEHFLIPSI